MKQKTRKDIIKGIQEHIERYDEDREPLYSKKRKGIVLGDNESTEAKVVIYNAVPDTSYADKLLLLVHKEMFNDNGFWEGGTHGLRANIIEYLQEKKLI